MLMVWLDSCGSIFLDCICLFVGGFAILLVLVCFITWNYVQESFYLSARGDDVSCTEVSLLR